MKTLQKVARVGVVPGAILIGLILFALLPGPAGHIRESGHATLPPPPMDQWKTYTDERFKFTFRYPPDWFMNVIPPGPGQGQWIQLSTYDLDSSEFVVGDVPTDYLKIEIVVPGGDPLRPGETLEEWVNELGSYDPSQVRQERYVVIAGREAFEHTVEYGPGWEVTTIYIPYRDATYGDTVLWISSTPFWQPSLEQVFRDIVSTFAFTD